MNQANRGIRKAQFAKRTTLPLDMRHFRAPSSFASRMRKAHSVLEPHLYFWTPALFCAVLFCALLFANFITWRV